jgi:hypothetical protein
VRVVQAVEEAQAHFQPTVEMAPRYRGTTVAVPQGITMEHIRGQVAVELARWVSILLIMELRGLVVLD